MAKGTLIEGFVKVRLLGFTLDVNKAKKKLSEKFGERLRWYKTYQSRSTEAGILVYGMLQLKGDEADAS